MTGRNAWLLLLAMIAAVWFPAINHLRYEWEFNEQYRFGFVVPLLAAYLFSLRWADRPAPSVPWRGWFACSLGVLLVVGLAPLMLAEGANPDWRLLSWMLTAIAAAFTLLCVGGAGGGRWAWHFAMPILFVLVAVPWPMRFESAVIQMLMRANAAIAVEMVNLFGIPAQQSGNLIDLGSATVGVDEACSGVRSLQTTLMAGLLLGELYRLPIFRRLGLVGVALVVALFWNLLRTLALVGITVIWGTSVMESWHDRVGLAVLVCSLGSVFGLAQLARWLDGPKNVETEKSGSGADASPVSVALPAMCCWGVIAWIALVAAGVELWYRSGTDSRPQAFRWTVQWPTEFPAMREVPIPHQTWRLMKFTTGANRTWQDDRGHPWSAYYLEWAPGRTAQMLAQVHRPDVCMAASGKTLIADRGTHTFTVHGVTLPFRHYVFEDGGKSLHVYFCLQSMDEAWSGEGSLASYSGLQLANRIALIRERRRNRGQQQLELGVWGVADESEAAQALQRVLEKVVAERR